MQSVRNLEQPLRLAALYSHPIQYVAPLMRTLAARSDVDLTVYYCSRQGLDATLDSQFGVTVKWDTPLLDGYRSQFLPNVGGERGVHGFTRLMNPAIVAELFHSRYDAILVHGYEHATKWLAFLAARLVGTPIVLRGESQLLSPRSRPVRLAKELLLRPLFRAISICTYIGEQNRAFYEYYGVEGDRLVFAPYVVDNTRFQRQCDQLTSCRNELRAALNVRDDRPIVLAAGKLITKKQPLTLLRAYQQVRAECSCALVFMGTGEMRAEIESMVQENNIPDVTITGFVNQSQVGEVYAAADILALPSENEPWGLVINEAMNFSLPIVASDRVGSVANLVRPGENGFVVDHRSDHELAAALRTLVMDPGLRQAYGKQSREIINEYSLERAAEALVDGVRRAVVKSGARS